MTDQQSANRLISPSLSCGFQQCVSAGDSAVRRDANADPIHAVLMDDDDFYREAISTELNYLGVKVSSVSSAEPLLAHLATGAAAEVLVLDWELQSQLGIDLLPALRERGISLPVVFLSGAPRVASECAALDLGAVDFVDKARGAAILAKRLRLIVETHRVPLPNTVDSPGGAPPIVLGKLRLNTDEARAYWDGSDAELTMGEFRVVHRLVSCAGDYVTYRSIYDCVQYAGFLAGTGEDGFRANVRSSIKRIRNKFRQLDEGFREIETYAAFGYRWRPEPADTSWRSLIAADRRSVGASQVHGFR